MQVCFLYVCRYVDMYMKSHEYARARAHTHTHTRQVLPRLLAVPRDILTHPHTKILLPPRSPIWGADDFIRELLQLVGVSETSALFWGGEGGAGGGAQERGYMVFAGTNSHKYAIQCLDALGH